MNQCAVLLGSILHKYDNSAFSVSQAVPMETFRAKQNLPFSHLAKACLGS